MKELSEQENIKVLRFMEQMKIEMQHNEHKGSVLEWDNFNHIIAELLYHQGKMLVALRLKNYGALKEYIADTAIILFALGNKFDLYNQDSFNNGTTYELDKKVPLFKIIKVEDQSKKQEII